MYQPALAAVGTALDFVTTVDPNKPLDSYNQGLEIAKQFNSQLFNDSSANLKAELAKIDPSGQNTSDYAKNVVATYTKWSSAIDQMRQSLQPATAPQNEVDAQLQKIKTEDPTFQAITNEVAVLNAKKLGLTKALADTTETMMKSSQVVTADLLALTDLNSAYNNNLKSLDHRTILQVREMGWRAEKRLEQYLYYMAKAFEYAFVLPYPGDLRVDDVVAGIKKMTAAGTAYTTDPAKFSLALEPYRQAIRGAIQAGVDKMQVNGRPQQSQQIFNLTADELKQLNDNGEVIIDLGEKVQGLGIEEEKRIANFRIDDAGIQVLPADSPVQISVGMTPIGDSIVSTTYNITSSKQYAYAFRFGTPDKPNPFTWTTRYYPPTNFLDPSVPDTADLLQLRSFLSGPNTQLPFSDADLSAFFYARPSAESLVRISRSGGALNITSLRFRMAMSYIANASGTYKTLKVKSPAVGAPNVLVNKSDVTGRAAGKQAFTRILSSGTSVTLIADTSQGSQTFKNWVNEAGSVLGTSPTLALTVSNARTVQPVYGPSGTIVNYRIGGTITDASQACSSGVSVTLSGGATATQVTMTDGLYSFDSLVAGNYTVTPAKSGCMFTPANRAFSLSADRLTESFTGASIANQFTVSGRVTVSGQGLGGVAINVSGSQTLSMTTDGSGSYSLSLGGGGSYTVSAALTGYGFTPPVATFPNLSSNQAANFTGIAVAGLTFYPVPPCRIADTRVSAGFPGSFGPPSLVGGTPRSFPVPSSSCGVPANAVAYSLNFTVVPPASGPQANLTTWPTGLGSGMPNVSTLNYAGTVVANAAIVPAGTAGAINVFANFPTDVLFDINGYFAPPLASGLDFYPLTPCRIADTRTAAGFGGQFGPPSIAGGATRIFDLTASPCGVPSTAVAYSLNFTVVPPASGPQANLTTWPATQATMPNVSTLNYSGSVVANAAIVPAGTDHAIKAFANFPAELLFDTNGYFAPAAVSGLRFYPVTPCRIADTRAAAGFPGQFGPPSMAGGSTRAFVIPSSSCGIPATAVAYSLNFTVVPAAGGPQANLTTWPTGLASGMPNVSTLNFAGNVVANAAIVPAGVNGSINIFVNFPAEVLFDINGYFAP